MKYKYHCLSKKKVLNLSAWILFFQLTTSCYNRYVTCPDDTFVSAYYYKDPVSNNQQYFEVNGNKLDTMKFEAFASSNNKTLPLYDMSKLPLDVSQRQTTFLFNRKNRSDTLIVSYGLTRRECDSKYGMYIQILNPLFIKNTFNESDTLINCQLSNYIY